MEEAVEVVEEVEVVPEATAAAEWPVGRLELALWWRY